MGIVVSLLSLWSSEGVVMLFSARRLRFVWASLGVAVLSGTHSHAGLGWSLA